MSQAITVSCKLEVAPELRQRIDSTLEAFAMGCNQILQVAKDSQQRNKYKLHHLCYQDVRAMTGLKANHVVQALARVCGALATRRQVRQFRPTSLALDARTFKFREDNETVGVTLIDGRVWLPLRIGNYQRALLRGQQPTFAMLSKRRNGNVYINITVEIPTQPPGKTPKVVGVDLGIKDIAHTSTGKSWSGSQLRSARERFFRTRRNVQSKRTRSSRRLLKRLSGKEQRFQKWVNHTISKQLVEEAQSINATIALEDLSGIRKAKVRRKQRRTHHGWAFYQLRQFVTYKARISGVSVVAVPAPYTSKTCSSCHHIGTRNGKEFKCVNCGLHIDADYNAALNISSLGVVVNQPEAPAFACELRSAS